RFGGHALYIKDGKLKYVYNWVGMFEQTIEASEPISAGHAVFSVSFHREGDSMPAEGTLTLHVGDRTVGEGRIKTQPGKFSLAGEGLNVGKDTAEPVTDDYSGTSTWPFVGGTIHRAVVDVSGEPFEDLAQEARMAFARDCPRRRLCVVVECPDAQGRRHREQRQTRYGCRDPPGGSWLAGHRGRPRSLAEPRRRIRRRRTHRLLPGPRGPQRNRRAARWRRGPGARCRDRGAGTAPQCGDVHEQHHGFLQRLHGGASRGRSQDRLGVERDGPRAAVRGASALRSRRRGVSAAPQQHLLAREDARRGNGAPAVSLVPGSVDDRAPVQQRHGTRG